MEGMTHGENTVDASVKPRLFISWAPADPTQRISIRLLGLSSPFNENASIFQRSQLS